jgi:hypothetical protein
MARPFRPAVVSPWAALCPPSSSVVWEWMQQLQQDGGYDEAETAVTLATFFAFFYVDDAYLASRDARFLQHALTLLVDLFECIGLLINTTKTQVMICTPRRIRTQLSSESYFWMKVGRITASEWNSRDIECYQCGKEMKASSLNRHLADVYDIYQHTMVLEDLLELRPPVVHIGSHAHSLQCPYPHCLGQLNNGWMMRRHFWDVHPLDLVQVPKEGRYARCDKCGIQVNPLYPRHQHSKECQVGVERCKQCDTAISSPLALCQQFLILSSTLVLSIGNK